MGGIIRKIWRESTILGERDLIFVTVGGMRAFERLVCQMDLIASELDEQVVIQIGSTKYEPKNCDYFRFMSRNDIERLYTNARVVVSHAGTGSILTALAYDKPLVLVPRMKKYREVLDDHQVELAHQMEAQGVVVVRDIGNLEDAIRSAATPLQQSSTGGTLVDRLREYINQLDK